jgi:NAD(P)-dependent dehydrogenase (short-subunit alcohol dehydrogenase family)
MSNEMETKKVALVTGGNKGIGLEIVRGLLRSGCQVYLGARDAANGQQAATALVSEGGTISVIELDLHRPATLAAAAARIQREAGRLDILVNNAGINAPGDGPASSAAVSSVEQVLCTNVLGTLAVTQAFLSLVKQSAAGRIVNVSSPVGSLTLNKEKAWPLFGYAASKAAVNMLTVQLAYELRDTAVKVNSAAPRLHGHRPEPLRWHRHAGPGRGGSHPAGPAPIRRSHWDYVVHARANSLVDTRTLLPRTRNINV